MYLGTSISNKFIFVHLVFELSNLCAKCFVSKIIFYTYKHFIIIIITFISANRLLAASIVDLLHSVFAQQQQLKAHCTTYVEHADVVKKIIFEDPHLKIQFYFRHLCTRLTTVSCRQSIISTYPASPGALDLRRIRCCHIGGFLVLSA